MTNPIDWLQSAAVAGALTAVGAGTFWFLRNKLPGIAGAKLGSTIQALKNSAWAKDPAHPQRAKLILAVMELIEAEIPEPGTDRAFYDRIAIAIVERLPKALSFLASPKKLADAAEAVGDKLDTTLDDEIKAIAGAGAPKA